LSAIVDTVRKQLLVIGFCDTFAVLGILVFVAAVIAMMMKGGRLNSTAAH
jgi:hypothetical protein